MDETEQRSSAMMAVSNAMVRLHKEQFGRGPTKARSYFAGPDNLLSILENVLVPAEQKLIEIGQEERVRDTRTSFQAATQADFIVAVEQIVHRKVRAFASAVANAIASSRSRPMQISASWRSNAISVKPAANS